jgi:hypothetical protein
MPFSSAKADWEKSIIAGATIAATASLRLCAEIGRPLSALASAIAGVIIILRKVCRLRIQLGDTVSPEQAGLSMQNSLRIDLPEKKVKTATKEQQTLHHGYRYSHDRLCGWSRPHCNGGRSGSAAAAVESIKMRVLLMSEPSRL